MAEWFRRLADVRGVAYEASPGLDRSKLPRHDAVPSVHVSTFEGKRQETLWWSEGMGGGSASPAHELAFQSEPDESTSATLSRLDRVLEVPGEASDYHFAIQSCLERLWAHRQEEPDQYANIERLCWLNIRLIEARPDIVTLDVDGERSHLMIRAFGYLLSLYEREGYLHEALEVAERAERLGQGDSHRRDLQVRIARLMAEGVGGPGAL